MARRKRKKSSDPGSQSPPAQSGLNHDSSTTVRVMVPSLMSYSMCSQLMPSDFIVYRYYPDADQQR